MIARIRAFAAFWYDFIVGDDPWVAAGVVAALAVTAAMSARHTAAAWWISVAAVVIVLPVSIYRVTRHRPESPGESAVSEEL